MTFIHVKKWPALNYNIFRHFLLFCSLLAVNMKMINTTPGEKLNNSTEQIPLIHLLGNFYPTFHIYGLQVLLFKLDLFSTYFR